MKPHTHPLKKGVVDRELVEGQEPAREPSLEVRTAG